MLRTYDVFFHVCVSTYEGSSRSKTQKFITKICRIMFQFSLLLSHTHARLAQNTLTHRILLVNYWFIIRNPRTRHLFTHLKHSLYFYSKKKLIVSKLIFFFLSFLLVLFVVVAGSLRWYWRIRSPVYIINYFYVYIVVKYVYNSIRLKLSERTKHTQLIDVGTRKLERKNMTVVSQFTLSHT